MDEQMLWIALAALGALALGIAILSDRRGRQRRNLDAVSVIPWPLVAIGALFALAIGAAKLLGLA